MKLVGVGTLCGNIPEWVGSKCWQRGDKLPVDVTKLAGYNDQYGMEGNVAPRVVSQRLSTTSTKKTSYSVSCLIVKASLI